MTLETALYGLFALLCGGLALLLFGRRLILKGAEGVLPEPRAARLEAIWKRGVWPIVASVVVLGIGTLTRGDSLGVMLEISGGLFMVGAIFGLLYFVMFSVELRKAPPLSAVVSATDEAAVVAPEASPAAEAPPAATASTGD